MKNTKSVVPGLGKETYNHSISISYGMKNFILFF